MQQQLEAQQPQRLFQDNSELLHDVISRFPWWQQALWGLATPRFTVSTDLHTQETLLQLNQDLTEGGVIINGDHQYPTDFFPMAIALANRMGKEIDSPLHKILVPHAFHLISEVAASENSNAWTRLMYYLRSKWFQNVAQALNSTDTMKLMPVVREFEESQPHIVKKLHEKFPHSDLNAAFTLSLIREAVKTKEVAGFLLFVSLAAGLNFPGRSPIHPKLHPSITRAQKLSENGLPIYVAGGYPLSGKYKRNWPLLDRYQVVMTRVGELTGDLDQDNSTMTQALRNVRFLGNFQEPDYDKMKEK